MSGFLLDTNVISEVFRPNPDAGVIEWIESTDEALLYLSVLTLGEIRKGIALLAQGKRRSSLEAWLDRQLTARFAGRVLGIDAAIADRWGVMTAHGKRTGRPLPVIDGLLGATALHHNLTVVSRNASDFAAMPIAVFDPWRR